MARRTPERDRVELRVRRTRGYRAYELEAGSPLIDAGTCTGIPSTDIEGDPRPSGTGCDIGADEFQF